MKISRLYFKPVVLFDKKFQSNVLKTIRDDNYMKRSLSIQKGLFGKTKPLRFFAFFLVIPIFTGYIDFFSPFIFISWRLITLQYCSGVCHTLT